MSNEEEFPINRTNRILNQTLRNIHEPAYLGYDIGIPILMGLRSGRTRLTYYAGFIGDETIKIGSVRVPHHICSHPESTYPILYTRELQVARTVKCADEEELKQILDNLEHLAKIELQFDSIMDQSRVIGFFKKTGLQAPTLAHSYSLRGKRADTWYGPDHIPRKDWLHPDREFSFEGVKEIRLLEEKV